MAATATRTLTADDVKALRAADSVTFFYKPNADRAGEIVCRKTVRNADPFGERERRWTVTTGSEFRGKHAGGAPIGPDTATCCESVTSAQYDEVWQTVAAMLKAGDELSLRWGADGFRNGYLESAVIRPGEHCAGESLHVDSLEIVIRRNGKTLVFLLDVSVCPNNTARMVRYAR